MDKKSNRSSRFKVKVLLFIFVSATFPILFPWAMCSAQESSQEVSLDPFITGFITSHATQIAESEQLIFATNRNTSSSLATIHAVERKNGDWQLVFPAFAGSIGGKGFSAVGDKREGDGKSPSGVFPLGTAFGYGASVDTKLPYRQATEDDFWVDDPDSKDYNQWVKGKPNAASWEKMKRDDDQYTYGVVIEYNMYPIVTGKGSAIFLHVWQDGEPTHGCLSMPKEMVLRILRWLDPARKPRIIMGTESELRAMRSP